MVFSANNLVVERRSANPLPPFSAEFVLLLFSSDFYATFTVFENKVKAYGRSRHGWFLPTAENLLEFPFFKCLFTASEACAFGVS